jgi:hypothetical protein
MAGYRGFASKEAYEAHYSDPRNYASEIDSMEQYAREAAEEQKGIKEFLESEAGKCRPAGK